MQIHTKEKPYKILGVELSQRQHKTLLEYMNQNKLSQITKHDLIKLKFNLLGDPK